jgi:hypothetical protein
MQNPSQSHVVNSQILAHIDSCIERISETFIKQWTRFEKQQQIAFNALIEHFSRFLSSPNQSQQLWNPHNSKPEGLLQTQTHTH